MNKNYVIAIGITILIFVYLFGDTLDGVVQGATGDTAFTRWDSLFKKYGAQYDVPWQLLKAIAMQESTLGQNSRVARGLENPADEEGSKSYDGLSWGIMQVTKTTAAGLLGRPVSATELNNPDTSVKLAAMLIRQLTDRFGSDDQQSIIRAYNGGPKFGSATLPYYVKVKANLAVVEGLA